ncbi:MAG: DUF3800 domain-containing protein [Desulfonatronovibrio sp.]
MSLIYNVYCDESCHLENDKQPIMLLGAVWCQQNAVEGLSKEMQGIKEKHQALGELKWSKVSAARQEFYLELVDWFFANELLHFRGLVVLNKNQLNHEKFNRGSHDDFYYKMYFSLLSKILNPGQSYNIYLDIKDTRSRLKLQKLKEVLCYDKYDFTSQMIGQLQNIRSHESQLLQLCDFFLGALSYTHRRLTSNAAKLKIISHLESKLGRSMMSSTPLIEDKFNLFLFTPRG